MCVNLTAFHPAGLPLRRQSRRKRFVPPARSYPIGSPRPPMASLWRAATGFAAKPEADYDGVEFWSNPERAGWLTKQGEYIKTWRRRWFVLKQGKLFWFKDSAVTRASRPRGVIPVASCLTVKGAEDILNKQYAFELSTRSDTMYFIADSEKEKEDWINSIGRSIVQHSRSVTDSEVVDYDSKR
ncbi:hypothetical protein BT93_E1043 [Corymbia citriodora subsp. variegata]|nr:hypothetical protein BT93_E1043 [Corymbia citriodora subsp. variegata]KAF8028311.1 hypothetical protein BT93_E1043 [Corymbia citriodora subsp. variegata]